MSQTEKFNTVAAAKLRDFTNPEIRLDVPPDFPDIMNVYKTTPEQKLKVIADQLAKKGQSIDTVKRINIAYPHKHPEKFPDHHNSAMLSAHAFKRTMEEIAPHIQWVVADAICDTVHLDRSGNQSSAHALIGKQVYDIHLESQKEHLPFIYESNTEQEFFVIVDNAYEQGTTMASLMSFIHHNGGTVLAATADGHGSLAQRGALYDGVANLDPKFSQTGRNNAALNYMACTFAGAMKYSREKWTPAECIEKLEVALNRHGKSVFSLTDRECRRMISSSDGSYDNCMPFQSLIDALMRAEPMPSQVVDAKKFNPDVQQESVRTRMTRLLGGGA